MYATLRTAQIGVHL